VVRIGHTTLALRRREVQSVWVDLHPEAHTRGVDLHAVPLAATP
jgi:hypothetical protein